MEKIYVTTKRLKNTIRADLQNEIKKNRDIKLFVYIIVKYTLSLLYIA